MIRLGLDPTLFPDLVDPGDVIGDLLPHVAERVGGVVPVVAVGSHDTASAVVGVPMQTDDAAYVSLGTWALAGLELDAPVLTEEARAASLTNEGGVDGTVRFLSNVMGTWLLSETLRTWGETRPRRHAARGRGVRRAGAGRRRAGPTLPAARRHAGADRARGAPSTTSPPPSGRVAVVRCIVESIAAAIAHGAASGRRPWPAARIGVVHVVGGGSQNTLLCQAIADRTGLPVLAGPVEATALGNVLVQARAAGVVGPGLADLRALVARTHDLARFDPAWPERIEPMRVALMVTCINDALFPDTGRAVVTLLRRLGVEVDFPEAQTCCGQPMVNTGYLDEAVPPLRSFVKAFDGYDAIVTPSGSCAGSARHQHAIVAQRIRGDPAPRRGRRADRTADLRAERVPRRRARGDRRRRVLPAPRDLPPDLPLAADAGRRRPARRGCCEAVRGLDLVELPRAEECCGFGGTFAVKNADTSVAMVSDKARHVRETGAEVLVAGDNSCLMNIGGALTRQRAGVRVMHLAEILAADGGRHRDRAPSSGCRSSRSPPRPRSRTPSCGATWRTPPRPSATSGPGSSPRSTTGRSCGWPVRRSRTPRCSRWTRSSSSSRSG